MNIYIESHGCSRRKLDVAKFHRYFGLNGYTVVPDPKIADVILVTTCAFKYDEEEESLDAIQRLGSYDAKIVVYGCLPVIAPTKYRKYSYVTISPKDIDQIDNYFEGITHKFADIEDANIIDKKINYSSLPDALKKFTKDFELSVPFFIKSCRYLQHKYLKNEQNYYLLTSRGCLGNCSYCGVRFAVGSLQSKPIETVISEFCKGIEAGYRKFSVLGDDVGGYGQDRGSSFCDLISALQGEIDRRKGRTSGAIRLEIEEINPRWIIKYAKDIVAYFSSENVKSLLCPIQSGNKRILDLMNRKDDIDHLMEILNEVKARNPGIILNTQIIVGFPTETEADFDDSLSQLSKVAFGSVVLFPYDDKENTKSFGIVPKVSESVKQERIRKAQAYLRQKGIKSALCCNE